MRFNWRVWQYTIVPVLKDPEHPGRKTHAYTVVSRGKPLGRAIRSQQWRYGKWPDGEELYDLRKDPHEQINLAGNPEYAARLKTMRKVLAQREQGYPRQLAA